MQWDEAEDAGRWAARREAEGWSGVSTQDHRWSAFDRGTAYHPFVTLALMASATSRVRISPAYANNLIRSPVEFAHASLTLAHASHGRYVAGLGAGWEATEIRGIGLDFPDPAPERGASERRS